MHNVTANINISTGTQQLKINQNRRSKNENIKTKVQNKIIGHIINVHNNGHMSKQIIPPIIPRCTQRSSSPLSTHSTDQKSLSLYHQRLDDN